MLNQHSIQAVNSSHFGDRFAKPLYETYNFAQYPAMLQHLLADGSPSGLPADVFGDLPTQVDKVVLFLVDGFGWKFIEQYADQYPFLKRFFDEGVVSKMTAQFPSTTTAHITSLHTGLPLIQTGVYEWYYYDPMVDAMICPLMYSYAGDRIRNTLTIAPELILPASTTYLNLQQAGVESYIFQIAGISESPYSNLAHRGANNMPYRTLSEGLVNLNYLLLKSTGKCYIYFYFEKIDSLSHSYGPDSPQVAAEIDSFFTALERIFHQQTSGKLKNTMLLLTADHGHVPIDPATTIYLNQLVPDILPMIRTNAAGQLLVPGGSARDLFLYIRPEYLEEAYTRLSEKLMGHAAVYRTADLVDAGIFGAGQPTPEFHRRMADLVILPYEGGSVWWYDPPKFQQTLYGMHGGLSKEEIEIGLLAQVYT